MQNRINIYAAAALSSAAYLHDNTDTVVRLRYLLTIAGNLNTGVNLSGVKKEPYFYDSEVLIFVIEINQNLSYSKLYLIPLDSNNATLIISISSCTRTA